MCVTSDLLIDFGVIVFICVFVYANTFAPPYHVRVIRVTLERCSCSYAFIWFQRNLELGSVQMDVRAYEPRSGERKWWTIEQRKNPANSRITATACV